MTRLLVVSHAAVLAVNQLAYAELLRRDWDVQLIVPARWRHIYDAADFAPEPLPELESRTTRVPVFLAGRPQRYLYRAAPLRLLHRLRPDALFIEEEPFALAAAQWSRAAGRAGVPFGIQQAETIDRPFPGPIRAIRSRILGAADFVAARSPRAAELALSWGARGAVEVIPHHVPGWQNLHTAHSTFTVGYAGRLSPEKGIDTLLAAMRQLDAPVELLVAGDGALRGELERADLGTGRTVRLRGGVAHAEMGSAYAEMDVLVLPSVTTPSWTEQFGRVLVEALWCGVPVIGSDSGEIPWVVDVTGGGMVVPEGDARALATAIEALRADPARCAKLAADGRRRVQDVFSVEAVAGRLAGTLAAAANGAFGR